MHYYSFNIGDYAGSTQHLEPMEDLAYRRMLDLYYSKETPLPESIDELARLIRMRSHSDCITIVLRDFFELKKDGYHCKRADEEISKFKSKSKKASKSASARWKKKQVKTNTSDYKNKGCERNANALQTQSEGNANQEPITNNQEPRTNNQYNIKDLFDAERIIPIWNSLGCQQHRGLTQKAAKAIKKTYAAYCKQSENPQELNDWIESYLLNGFANWMTNHHRQMNDGQWAADLEFAVRFDTYEKVKNTVE